MTDGARHVTFPSNGGEAHGYLASPDGSGPGVIVIQEWWGLTSHVREVTDRFAAEGFVALAPDIYGGTTTHDAAEAARLMDELPLEGAARDLSGAAAWLLARNEVVSSSVGAVGFCMGGAFVLVLAAIESHLIGAAVPYYAVGPYDEVDLSAITAPVLGHFASEDAYAPPERVHELERQLSASHSPSIDLRIHERAGHGFFNDEGSSYDPELAAKTWDETVAFLRAHLR